jgi:hypothetical protein
MLGKTDIVRGDLAGLDVGLLADFGNDRAQTGDVGKML